MLAEAVINSDSHGNPDNFGGHLHVIVVCDLRPIPGVSQMRLPFGALDNVSCAVAASLAMGLMFDEQADVNTVLAALHTSFATNGTQGQYIPPTLKSIFGLDSQWSQQPTLPPCWVMNPAWGGVIAPADSGPYIAALHQEPNTGNVLTVTTPLPGVIHPLAFGGTQEMIVGPLYDSRGHQFVVWALGSDGNVYEAWGAQPGDALNDLNLQSGKITSDIGATGPGIVHLSGSQMPNGDVLLVAIHKDGSVLYVGRNSATGQWYPTTNVPGFTALV